MSDWFKNPSSEIPDELWKAPAPMQRQADAVVLWAELTGKHASAKDKETRRTSVPTVAGAALGGTAGAILGGIAGRKAESRRLVRDGTVRKTPGGKYVVKVPEGFTSGKNYLKHRLRRGTAKGALLIGAPMAIGGGLLGHEIFKGRDKTAEAKDSVRKAIRMAADNPAALGAVLGGVTGAGKTYFDHRVGPGGISKQEAEMVGNIAAARAQNADKEAIDRLRKKLEAVKNRRENLGRTVALGGGLGAGAGALLGAYYGMGRVKPK